MTYSSADDFYLEGYEKGVAEGLERGRSEAMQARLIAIEECAKIAEPKGPRPCDCEGGHCYCHNMGDAMAVASWDADMAVANAIRALSSPLTSNKLGR
ncbi:hypothetical protein IVB34_12530 [Bradyrhizobium sp. 2]|uniref:hypothetical protein n=1 Tax=Bradyrhizobium sp. 2 TaxID=190045 RepID=UPI001FF89244|nr:hypothetical protein [Bradyrhizobium sp. 2]MCK1459115.1 hypothetical protein [Bradyrhizobium sp. 2]MCK1459181.1 hypothetical protein [Bradyrhizobium sp. 2]